MRETGLEARGPAPRPRTFTTAAAVLGAALWGMVAWSGAAFGEADQAAPADGWVELFDGRSLRGWKGDPAVWRVEDGDLVGRTTADAPLSHSSYLMHEGEWGDFEFTCRFRLAGGNSGVQYRSRDDGRPDVTGPQADMDAADAYTGVLYDSNGRGLMSARGEDVLRGANGRSVVLARSGTPEALAANIHRGDWNDYRIVARGEEVVHEINGVVMSRVRDRQLERRSLRGALGLQVHMGPPMEVRYRSLKVRPLPPPAAPEPEWIWGPDPAGAGDRGALRTTFVLPEAAPAATLRATADNHVRAFVDGAPLLSGDDWATVQSASVPGGLAAGPHELRLEVANDDGPAAAAATLQAGPFRVVTDASWEWVPAAGGNPAAVVSLGPVSHPRGPWPNPFAERSAPPPSSISVPAGFTVELLRSAQAAEGSWVAMTFDDAGRIYISPQRGPLLRLTLPSVPGGAVAAERVPAPIGSAQGLAWLDGRLWANVALENRDGGGLWRVEDADGDGMPERAVRVMEAGTDSEHGPHGVVAGPDGMLWVVNGNHTPLPRERSGASPLAHWSEDLLLGREWDPRGHASGVMAPGGCVFRVDPRSGECLVWSGGLRNSYDLAFNDAGEAFVWDSDMEWDLGAPWYRPPRLCHVVSGGESGWRSGSGKWPSWYPDSLPAAVDTDLASPTGMVWGGRGNFPEPWRSSILAGDWAYGRIVAFHLRPDGASWRGSWEPFATGRPMPITDMEFGPDGALYVITGGRGTQSGLYRISAAPAAAAAPTTAAAAASDAAAARERRRRLERLHTDPRLDALDEVCGSLRSTDRFERFAARVALEHLPPDAWRARALAERSPRPALEMLLALARTGGRDDLGAIIESLAALAPATAAVESPAEWRRSLIRTAQVAIARHGTPDDAARTRLLEAVDRWFPSGDFQLDRALAELLLALRAPRAIERTVDAMEAAADPQRQMAFAFLLRGVPEGWTAQTRARYASWIRGARTMQGGYSLAGYVDPLVRATEAAAGPLPGGSAPAEGAAAQAARAAVLPHAAPSSRFVRAWTVADLEAALDQLGAGRDVARGAMVFQGSSCAMCHRVSGIGGTTGPDLTGTGARFSRRDLLQAILEPSAVVADQYRDTLFELHDGSVVAGRVVEERDGAVVVATNPLGPERETIRRADVASATPLPTSPMPKGLLDGRTREEILDLLAYLEQARSAGGAIMAP